MTYQSTLATDSAIQLARRALDEATHLPGGLPPRQGEDLYQGLARRRACREIEKPGDYLSLDIMDEPFIVARDSDGAVHAYYNICAHRGVEVASGAGNTTHFKCPYHAWTYDLTGKLMGAAYMEDVEDFDLDQCRLKPIRSKVWQGWIFVNFDNEAPALTDFIADYAGEFGFLNQDRFRLSAKRTTKLACNWKLVNENFVDIYHILTLHSDTLVNWPKPEDYAYRRLAHGGYAAFYDNLLPTLDPLIELGPAPWLEPHLAGKNTKTYPAAGFLSPNVTSIIRPYCISQMIVWPRSPNTCEVG